MEGICKHYQKGFCKFLDNCRKQHIKESCPNENCSSTSCNKRHPRVCNFFTSFRTCKFGDNCACNHTISRAHSDISELQSQLNTLSNTISVMSTTIDYLVKELEGVKTKSKHENIV